VPNRISIIREASDPAQWWYVHTKQNPADDASRGLTVHKLLNSKTWLSGPGWALCPAELLPELQPAPCFLSAIIGQID